jgi:hypothetical protein
MTRLEGLQTAVTSLPEDEYDQFRRWFLDRDWEDWDRQIAEDSDAGRLEFLVRKARVEIAAGTQGDL